MHIQVTNHMTLLSGLRPQDLHILLPLNKNNRTSYVPQNSGGSPHPSVMVSGDGAFGR